MNASDTLLDLCERLARDPDAMLESATGFSARSEDERRLFAAFQAMLERIEERRKQQSAEHERAKAELAALRRQHELILSATGEGIYGIDRAGLTTFVNPAAARLLGWEPAELLGRPAHAVLHHTRPDGKPYPHEECPIYATLQDVATHTDDTEVFWRRDGSSFPVEYVSTPIVERGELVGAVITFRDISKRKAAEAQQRSSEAELQALFAAIRDVVLVLDGEGRYVKVAPTAPELLTHKVEELAGKTLYDVLPPHQAGEFLAHIRTALARQERVEHEYSLGLESGEHWFAASISPMDESRVVLVARDITERKRAEARLREKEEQYRSIFEGVTDGLVVTDLETGVLVTANPAAAQMHGYTLEEFVGLPAEAIVEPGHRHKLYAALEAVKATGRFRQEAFDVRKDGTAFPVEVHGRTFIYLGKPHALGVIRDVTERKHAEARLREKEEQYRGIFDATGDGLLIRTLDGII
ncbi:MAG TPA: PAS domain S-box protein, partial [Ardenticatenaceae bacterium]|nr:PAS domain S-box protein [Ardenticatenaceae bacterium]